MDYLAGGISPAARPAVCLSRAFSFFHFPHRNLAFYHYQSAMETRPHSPETAAFVASSLEAWNKFLSAGDSESDVDSVRQHPSTSEDPDSFTEDSLDDALLSVIPTPSMPPKSDETYAKLASVMGSSYLELAELVRVALYTVLTVKT